MAMSGLSSTLSLEIFPSSPCCSKKYRVGFTKPYSRKQIIIKTHTQKKNSKAEISSCDGWRLSANSESVLASIVESEGEECNLVTGRELELGLEHNLFEAYLVEAVKNHNGAGILILSDVEGHGNADTRDFAYRLACFGFSVLVPDLFRGNPWSPLRPKSEYEDWRSEHPADRVATDIDVAVNYLNEHLLQENRPLGPGKMGLIGFCIGGGRLMETMAADSTGLFSAGVFFYGTRFDPAVASHIKTPLLLICGDSDPLCPVATVQEVERNASNSQMLLFPGRSHGFAHHPQSVEDDEDAEKAFTAAKHWLQVHLRGSEAGPWVG